MAIKRGRDKSWFEAKYPIYCCAKINAIAAEKEFVMEIIMLHIL